MESAIRSITGETSEAIGSSRTDAGVHAKEFVCNFHTCSRIPQERFKDALNSRLPGDIVVLDSTEVPENFHSRYDCIGKTYNYSYHYKGALNIDAVKSTFEFITGTHDFTSFRNLGSSVKTSVRTVTDLSIEKNEDIIKIFISADGFLYNMVRIIVGTLIEVGNSKIHPQIVKEIIEAKDRSLAGPSVPPQGLCLEKVYYY